MYEKNSADVVKMMVLWAFLDQNIDTGICGAKWRLCAYLWGFV